MEDEYKGWVAVQAETGLLLAGRADSADANRVRILKPLQIHIQQNERGIQLAITPLFLPSEVVVVTPSIFIRWEDLEKRFRGQLEQQILATRAQLAGITLDARMPRG